MTPAPTPWTKGDAVSVLHEWESNGTRWRVESRDGCLLLFIDSASIDFEYDDSPELGPLHELARLARELEATKKAKAENDERFMLERDEARAELREHMRTCNGFPATINEWPGRLTEPEHG